MSTNHSQQRFSMQGLHPQASLTFHYTLKTPIVSLNLFIIVATMVGANSIHDMTPIAINTDGLIHPNN